MTASTAAEIRAGRVYALRGSLQNPQRSSMDHSFGGTNFLHLCALPRQDTRNQNGAARMVAQGLAAVDQLARSKFEGHGGAPSGDPEIGRSGELSKTQKRKTKNETGNSWRFAVAPWPKPRIEKRKTELKTIFDFRISLFDFPAHPTTRSPDHPISRWGKRARAGCSCLASRDPWRGYGGRSTRCDLIPP